MFKYRLAIATLLSALSLATLPASSLMAQAPPQGTKAGVLACKLSPSIGLIIGSRQRMSCAACLVAEKANVSKDCANAIENVEKVKTQ